MLSLQNIKSIFTRFKVNEDGNFAIMAAIGGLTLVAAIGLSLDMLGARKSQQELQSHLDMISIAVATSGIEDAAEQRAFALELLKAHDYKIDPASLDIQMDASGEVHVTGQSTYKLALGGVVKKDQMAIRGDSSAIAGGTSVTDPVDVVLVLDTTGSMAGTKMTALQSSACLLYTSPIPRDLSTSRMPSSA